MTTLRPEQLEIIRKCARDDESYAELRHLFEQQHQSQAPAVVDLQMELVCRYLPDTTLTFVNEAYCRFFNQPADQLVGHSLLEFLDDDIAPAVQRSIEAYITNPDHVVNENAVRRYDGEVRLIQWTRQPVRNSHQELVEIQAVGRDITDLKQAEEALNRSEERYRRVIEASPDGILITRQATILYVNPALVRLLHGQHADELIGKSVFEILVPADHDFAQERITNLGHDQENVLRRRERYLRLDGECIDVEVSIDQIELDGQNATLTFVHDITHRVQMENAVHQFQDQLRALHQLGIRLSKAQTFADFCRQAVEDGRTTLGLDRMGLWLLNDARTHTVGSFGTDEHGNTIDERDVMYPIDDEFAGSLFGPSHNLSYRDQTDLVDHRGRVVGTGWSALTALWNGDEVIGFLSADNLMSQVPASASKLELLVLYGATLGHLATRIRAEEALRISEEAERDFQHRLRTLHEVSMELAKADSFDTLCRQAVEMGCRDLNFDRIGLWFTDDADQTLLHGSFGIDERGVVRDERGVHWHISDRTDSLTEPLLKGEATAAIMHDAILHDHQNQVVGHGWRACATLMDGSRLIGCIFSDNLISRKPAPRYVLELLKLYGATLGHLAVRQWANDALQRSEKRYRAIFEAAGTGICIVNTKGYPVSYNPMFRQMLGFTDAELRRRTFSDITHPDDRADNLKPFNQLLAGKIAHYRHEKRYVLKDGSDRWVRINVSAFPGEEPNENYVVAVVEDIHDQKLMEASLRESEARNRVLLDTIPDMFFILNTDGRFVDFHAPIESRLLTGPEQFLNRHYSEVLPPHISQQTDPHFKAVTENREMRAMEYTLPSNGEMRSYESRMIPYGDGGVLCLVRDITERIKAEEQLRESEARFRQIADHVDEVFFIRDPNSRQMLYVNPAYEKIWQRPRSELYADPQAFAKSVHQDDLQIVQSSYQNPGEDAEYRIVRSDGAVRWVWTRHTLIHDDTGKVVRVIGLVKDITERKQVEHNNLELSLQREHMRIIANFIRDASHQFRTPLSVINAKVYLAQRVATAEERQVHLQGIQAQSDNILKLVESLMSMSRLDGNTPLTLHTISLEQVLRAICNTYKSIADDGRLELALEIDPSLIPIQGDLDELHDAFSHLLDNAVRYTPEGGRVIVRASAQDDDHAIIEFEDTGSGIGDEDLPYIFDRFYRGGIAFSKPGFGLGLSLVKKVVERHNGQIRVRSEESKGSVFTLLLPVHLEAPS